VSSEQEIEILLKAAYPIICVFSYEERRVEAAVKGIINRRNKERGSSTPVYYWSSTEGLVSTKGNKEAIVNPLAILDKIGSDKKPGVFILRDFHVFMGDGVGAQIQRKLKDLAYFLTLKASHRHIIIVGHHFEVPASLDKLVAVVDFDLPKSDLLKDIIQVSLTASDLKNQWKALHKDKATLNDLVNSLKGLTAFEAESVLSKSLVSKGTLDIPTIIRDKKHIIRKSGVLEFYEPDRDMSGVGGLDNLKSWLGERGKAFTVEAKKYGLPTPKGVLIIGVPGTGKSLISKAIGISWSMPVLRMDVGSLFGSFVGQSEANMRKAMRTAEAMAPCILWIDEIEKGLGQAQGGHDSGTSARVFGSFLNWMQEKTASVFVVATANDVSQLPPEMLRKGRFDEIFFSDLPTGEERLQILKIHLEKVGRDPSKFMLSGLVDQTVGFSGAELEQVVIDALFAGFFKGREPDTPDLLVAANKTVPLSKTMEEKLKDLRDWAEARARPAGKVIVQKSDALIAGRKIEL